MNNDLISRDALKNAILEHRDDYIEDNFFWSKLFDIIDNAPTVEPQTKIVASVTFSKEQMEELVEKAKADILEQIERPQGEWKLHGMIYYCSVCGHDYEQGGNNFCGNCGADMRGEKNDE